jgi:hypothetical protein
LMRKYRIHGWQLSLLVLCGLFAASCEEDINVPEGALDEQMVDLRGVWKVKQALVNNIDISSAFAFDQITLTLQMDQAPSSFEINTGEAPFPVVSGGSWTYNDVSFPTAMQFNAAAASGSVAFAEAPISGDSTFKVSFSLGCQDNVYTYTFEKQ